MPFYQVYEKSFAMNTNNPYCDFMMAWRSPLLSDVSFGCFARERANRGDVNAAELDALVSCLPTKLRFDANFHRGKKIVIDPPPRPVESDDFDYEDEAACQAFDAAVDAWCQEWWGDHAPTAWVGSSVAPPELSSLLLHEMQWTLNNKTYQVTKADGKRVPMCFSDDENETRQIAEQEQSHQLKVEEFVSQACELFSDSYRSFVAENLLDYPLPDYENCNDPDYDDRFELFYDRTIALVSDRHAAVLWFGHQRYWG